MTLIEYDAAMRGYLEAKGVSVAPRVTRDHLHELMARYPDTPTAGTS